MDIPMIALSLRNTGSIAMEIIGREKEQAVLRRCLESKKPEFLAVYGRRRVGKTFLIREYYGDKIVFSLTGAAKSGISVQLGRFNEAFAECSGEDAMPAKNWFEAFRFLKQYLEKRITVCGKDEKLVVFIDELPWLATQKSDFVSALEHFWNSWGSMRPELLLVICGSATSWIIENIIRDHGGLHNRVTRRLLIDPFSLGDVEMYLKALGVSLSRMQISELYMAVGGIPYYLDYTEPGLSTVQIIDRMFFARDAQLAGEFDELFASLFKNPASHIHIIEALAEHGDGLTQKELARMISKQSGGSLSKTLAELEQCGFIRKIRDFTLKKSGHYYKLIDFYTLFYIKHIRDHHSSDEHFWQNRSNKGAQLAWNGLAFERLCAAHLSQIKQRLGILGVSTDASSWKSKHSRPSAQIDLVIDREDGIINLCEMKYTGKKYLVTAEYDTRLRHIQEIFREETGTRKMLHVTMVTASGLDEGSYHGEIQSEVVLDDLFRPIFD
jgi:AAA+ ATPase superfamily predicted ATPase